MNTNTSSNKAETTNQSTATDGPPVTLPPAAPIRNPQSEIRNHPNNPNRPRSNIARLPCAVREMVNVGLREGLDYREIIIRVEALTDKFHGVTPSVLSRWFKTGYQDWLREKTRLENTIAQGDAALTRLARIKQETGADLPDLLATFLASLLQTALQDFDPARLNALLAEKPAEVFHLITCLNSHIAVHSQHQQAEIARVRCQIQVAEKAQAASQEPVPAKNLYESEVMRRSFGTPLEQFIRAFKQPASKEQPEKTVPAAKTDEKAATESRLFAPSST